MVRRMIEALPDPVARWLCLSRRGVETLFVAAGAVHENPIEHLSLLSLEPRRAAAHEQ